MQQGKITVNPIDYYRQQFREDLETVASGFDSISVVSLKGRKPGPYREESSRAFHALDEKRPFLFCYFFCVLLDQSVHSVSGDEHAHFEPFWQCPKFQGILATAHTNLHPALILDAAVRQIRKEEEEASSTEFAELAGFFSKGMPEDSHRGLPGAYGAIVESRRPDGLRRKSHRGDGGGACAVGGPAWLRGNSGGCAVAKAALHAVGAERG
ncbi:hypothetical protein N9E25_07580 [Verrucomicrobiales bacterium]|nr:hypothetical protein [Verrucomicrobiales bacterium]